ncbi:MAG: hypothetical protein RL329_2060 [Bacteroidota bacterium]|jgi:hypothetical protein
MFKHLLCQKTIQKLGKNAKNITIFVFRTVWQDII